MLPIVLQSEPDIELLHTLEVELSDDPGQVLISERFEDCATTDYQHLFVPVEKIPAICGALMKVWLESQQ